MMAAKMMGQYLFAAWRIPDPFHADEESKVPVTVRQYTKRDISPNDVMEALEPITEICDCLWHKGCMKRVVLSLETPYYTIHILLVWEYLQLLDEGVLK